MSKVLMPQMAQTSNNLIMSSTSQTKFSKEKQNLQSTNHHNNNNSGGGSRTINTDTTPIDVNHHYSSSESTITNSSVPQSPTQLLDFDDFTSTSSIMEFLRQEQTCAAGDAVSNGHDSEVDAESIFQEVSRLADNSDTRSVDELLREAELLLQHQHFMGNIRQQEKKVFKTRVLTSTSSHKIPQPHPTPPQTTSIQMNSKYTKSIENVHPRDSLIKLINGYVPASTPLDECSPPLMTPETPTVTYSLSDVVGVSGNTFNNFVNNIRTESVISEESTPVDFPDDNTATITHCSSNDNTTGKDITTKQMDGDDDTDDGTDTVTEFLSKKNLPVKALLLIDNAPSHPSELELKTEDGNIIAMFFPPNVTPLIQSMDQNAIKITKLYYRTSLLAMMAAKKSDLVSSMKTVTLKDAVTFLEIAWNKVSTDTMAKCWKNLLSFTESEEDPEENVPLSILKANMDSELQLLMTRAVDVLNELNPLIEEITEAMETIELIVHDNDDDYVDDDGDEDCAHGDADGDDDDSDRKEPNDQFVAMPPPPPLSASNENLAANNNDSLNLTNSTFSSISSIISTRTVMGQPPLHGHGTLYEFALAGRRPSCEITHNSQQPQMAQQQSHQKQTVSSPNLLASPQQQRLASSTSTTTTTTTMERCNSGSYLGRRSSMTTPDSGVSSQTYLTGTCSAALSQRSSSPNVKSIGIGTTSRSYCDKSVNSSPVRVVSTLTSPINETATIPHLVSSASNHSMVSLSREHALKHEIEQLQERLKDTEERLESFRIQHDTVSQLHRKLRESNTQLQDESEMLKLDVQHLNECANVLRTELQSARNDRDEALELQKVLQNELEETRADRKRALELKEKDVRTIQDLQRQCREMERILMRKHPDSVSALIVASKGSGMSSNDMENRNSRKLLEQRIAQLEADAKEQDFKAQQILANVQARFNSVQAKYETHIADLETQVLSLQEINTKLNEKIESQVRTLDYFVSKKAEKFYNNCTQTDEPYMPLMPVAPTVVAPKPRKICRKTISTQTANSCTRETSTNTIGSSTQPHSASSSTSSTANSTPNNSRPNSKQSGIRKPMATATGNHLSSAITSKLPVSQSESTISLLAAQAALNAKEDAHLVATIRGMRVDLAIKNKALQRLTRELDECKRTIKKIQREKDAFKYDKHHSTAASASSSTSRLNVDHMPATTESQALKEALNKYKLLEADYKSLHDKRLQDLKTLQTAHERELATCHETVRLLQQRLNERDEQFAMQKRRKVPVDYYALKAKVSSLERRHTEREERLHMLVEALSKGRLNGALDDLLTDNNNQ